MGLDELSPNGKGPVDWLKPVRPELVEG